VNYRKALSFSIGAGDATSSAVEMTGWKRGALELPIQTDFSTASATIGFLGSSANAGTYYPLIYDATTNFLGSSIMLMDTEAWPRFMKVGADRTAIADYAVQLHVTD